MYAKGKDFSTSLNQKKSGFEGTHECSMCKSVISNLLIMVVDPQEKKHHQMRMANSKTAACPRRRHLREYAQWRQRAGLAHPDLDVAGRATPGAPVTLTPCRAAEISNPGDWKILKMLP